MLGHERIGGGAMLAQHTRRTRLVGLHQPAVADHVGREDGGETAVHPILRSSLQGVLPGRAIRSFFTEVSQQWVVRFLEHRIGDKRIIRLVQKWLRGGVLEDGIVTIEEKGTGQGSVISPLLANVYLHYVFDLWAERWRRRQATGDMSIVRYADDTVIGFEHEADARRFWDAMHERLREFSLSLHPDKTRLIEFGRHAAQNREKRGLGKPETFKFLGFCADLRQIPARQLPDQEEVTSRPHAREAAGDQGRVAATMAPAHPRHREMARANSRTRS
jgi:Reverse transcriptase (RNA-dependent DNA polymerase)